MFSTIRDVLTYAYGANEKMEEKANEFREDREKHMVEFREKIESATEEATETFKDRTSGIRDKAKSSFEGLASEAGLVTKSEMGELHEMISELTEKVDKLAQKSSS